MQTTILTDIEGTTSSISFVKDVLFPYARRELPRFVRERGDEPEVRRWLDMVAAEHGGICQDAVIVETLQGMIDQDRKHTALKALQGMIWLEGYRSRDFSAHVYPDVAPRLREWRDAGNSDTGDLLPLFDAFFDTEAGHKRDADSYRLIADRLHRAVGDVLFLSDVVAELDAAREAGMRTVLLDRREDYPQPRIGEDATHGHLRVESFDGIQPQAASIASLWRG